MCIVFAEGFIRKLLYTATGAAIPAAVCYPETSKDLIKVGYAHSKDLAASKYQSHIHFRCCILSKCFYRPENLLHRSAQQTVENRKRFYKSRAKWYKIEAVIETVLNISGLDFEWLIREVLFSSVTFLCNIYRPINGVSDVIRGTPADVCCLSIATSSWRTSCSWSPVRREVHQSSGRNSTTPKRKFNIELSNDLWQNMIK